MEQKLLQALKDAVEQNQDCIKNHLRRTNKNNHSNITDFQDGILNELKTSYPDLDWEKEVKIPTLLVKDSVDILGTPKPKSNERTCVIEIDTVRHDQLAAKFVSRIALYGLSEPIDYVAVLYPSTQKSGKPTCEKYIRYMYDILKDINKDSSLIGIYVDVDVHNNNVRTEVWNCDNMGFAVNGRTKCKSMKACAREAVKHYIGKHPKIKYADLCNKFTQGNTCYIDDKPGPSRYVSINKTVEGHPIHVYSQFRFKGNNSNWYRFVELCAKLGIKIETTWF